MAVGLLDILGGQAAGDHVPVVGGEATGLLAEATPVLADPEWLALSSGDLDSGVPTGSGSAGFLRLGRGRGTPSLPRRASGLGVRCLEREVLRAVEHLGEPRSVLGVISP